MHVDAEAAAAEDDTSNTATRDGEWSLGEGIFLLALAAAGLGLAIAGQDAAALGLPFLLLLCAVDEFLASFEREPFGGSWHVVLAGAAMLSAVVLLGENTSLGNVPHAIFPGGYFVICGILRLAAALRMRHVPRSRWLLLVGLASLALGAFGLSAQAEGPATAAAMVGIACALSGVMGTGRGISLRAREDDLALER